MKRVLLAVAALCAVLAVGFATAPSRAVAHQLCSSGYVDAVVGGEQKCLHAGEFCSAAKEADYERYGFTCVDGRLQSGGSAPPPARGGAVAAGATVLLAPQTRHAGCRISALPDRRCTPGAYSAGLTKDVICSSTFRTGSIRHVTEATRHLVEREYGLAPVSYGRTLEVDHLVSLELGGSNAVANLFPEKAPGYRIKDRLENAAHDAVCNGTIALPYAQRQIASNWKLLYKQLFGVTPGV